MPSSPVADCAHSVPIGLPSLGYHHQHMPVPTHSNKIVIRRTRALVSVLVPSYSACILSIKQCPSPQGPPMSPAPLLQYQYTASEPCLTVARGGATKLKERGYTSPRILVYPFTVVVRRKNDSILRIVSVEATLHCRAYHPTAAVQLLISWGPFRPSNTLANTFSAQLQLPLCNVQRSVRPLSSLTSVVCVTIPRTPRLRLPEQSSALVLR